MSVAEQLGLRDESSEWLVVADRRWAGWVGEQPRLAAVEGMPALRGWLRDAGPGEADGVLHALATLGAADGGDDPAAAAAVAWALLPGASALARRLRTLSPRIDEVVAAQLWIEVRTFPWRRLSRVAGNVLANTRAGVLRDCGAPAQLRRADRTWGATSPLDPAEPFWAAVAAPEPGPGPVEELLELLDWACQAEVITEEGRGLLLCLAEEADRAATGRVRRGCGGLMANDVSRAVAEQWGVSAVTVRRRARRSLRALTAAATTPRAPGRAGDRRDAGRAFGRSR